MAKYDGSVRINTDIKTKEAEIRLLALENRIKKTADKITALRSKMDALKDAKIPTQEYTAAKKEVDKYSEALQRAKEKIDKLLELGVDKKSSRFTSAQYEVARLENKLLDAEEVVKRLESEGKSFTLGSDTKEYAKIGQQLQYYENEMSVLNRQHDAHEVKIEKLGNKYKELSAKAKSAFNSIGNVLKKANETVNAFGRKLRETAQEHLPFFRKETERVKSSLSGFKGRIKSLALSLLVFNQISAAFRAASSAISAGFKNLYDDNEQFKASIDGLKASVLTLQNAFAAAFRPIVDMAVPYIQKLVEWLTHAVNLAGQFFAALTGRKTYTRAIKQTAKASEEAAEAAEDETEAMKKQLSPLDKLNNLTSENNKKKDKDKDDSGASTGIMFEEVPIDSGILEMADKVKDILSKLFAPLKAAWDKEGEFVMKAWKYALDEIWKLIKDIGRDFLEVWNQPETIDMLADILHIIGDIGLIVGHLARNFREAWNENETGKRILENIRDILAVIIHNIRIAADKTVEWADNLDFGPLLEAFERFSESLIPVADALSGVLADFYTQVLLPLGKWTIEKGLPELLDVFTAFNEKVDWDAIRERLSEFWDHLEPFAETVGEGLIIFIERVSNALADFINSEAFDNFLTMIEKFMDSVTPEDVADGLGKIAGALIGLKVALLGYSAIKGINGIFDTIKSFLAIFGVGGSVATTAANMDTMTNSIGGLSEALTGLAAATAVAGSYKLLTGHLEELFASFGKSTDQGKRLEERYEGLDGAARFAKDGIDTLKNGIEGYGFAADNCVGSGVAIEKAMEDIANGAILSDHHMEELQKRFSLTDEDMEMLRQEMLDTNPILREIADNLGFEGASAETLYDIAEGFSYIANGIEPLPNQMSEMTDEARDFISRVEEGVNPMEVYGEKLENIGSIADNANESLNNMGKNIADGVTKGMEEADVGAASGGFFSKVVASIKEVFGIASPAKNMVPIGEYITLGVLEGFKGMFEAFTAPVQQLCEQIKMKLSSGLQAVRSVWQSIWNALPGVVTGVLNKILSSLSSFVSNISKVFGSISSGMRSIGGALGSRSSSSRSYSAASYVANPAYASLASMDIPAYATGQVIPRSMKQHLAILGDNNRETEVVSPLSTLKQALREEAISLGLVGNGNGQAINLDLTVECEGYRLLHLLQKLDSEYYKQNGKHALA